MRGLAWQTLHLPFGVGVDQKADDRALSPPQLAMAKDVQFEEHGGLQTRKPFTPMGTSIFGGGTLSNVRRGARDGDEQLVFTKDALLSWNAAIGKWVSKGTHLAVAIDETAAFTTTGDQRDCDRAELAGTVLFAWVDAEGLWIGAQDKTTRSVLMAPTLANAVGTRPRFVVCSTKILLFWVDTAANDIEVIAIDPAEPATAVAGAATTVFAASNLYYDVVKVPGADTAIGAVRRAVTTSYEVFKVTQALAVTTSTKARTCDGPIAVSCEPTGTSVQIVRGNSTNVQGDRLTISSLADAATGQAIGTAAGTPIDQIAAAHRSVQTGGDYRCYAFWSALESPTDIPFTTKYNFVDTAGTIGTQAVLVRNLGVASRAFDHDGQVFVWLAFAGESPLASITQASSVRAQLQNTYFLYGDDTTLHSRSVWQRGGGLSPSTGRLPHVALVSGTTTYAWCGTERRIIPLGPEGHTGYADRGPVDVLFTFDSNEARRCVRLGATLYITGGLILQYDGEGPPVEVGFLVYPWNFQPGSVAGGGAAVPDGTYTLKQTYRWQNARGERERSTTATGALRTITGGPLKLSLATGPLHVTRKQGSRRAVALEGWRTKVNPPLDAPFFLTTSNDPGVTSGDNKYLANNPSSSFQSMDDNLTDALLGEREANPENGDVLEALAPPPARIIAATESRLFMAGVAADPDRVWYSKLRHAGELAAFHDQLVFDVPQAGGDITAIAFMQGLCVVFRRRATYMFPGDGFDNFGAGANYGPVQIVSEDIGCRDPDSVVVTPVGIAFQSDKGKYLLTRGWTLQPLGTAVVDYDSETVVAAHVVEQQHQIRWLTGSRLLVLDYLVEPQAWAEWTITSGVHAVLWDGTYHYLTAAGAQAEQSGYADLSYGSDVETAWIKPANLQGAVAIRWLELLGENRSEFLLRARLSYDYDPTVIDDKVWTVTPAVVGGPLQVKILPSRPKCQAIKLRLTALGGAAAATLSPYGDFAGGRVHLSSPTAAWDAVLTAVPLGELGNAVTFSIGFVTGATAIVEVRDDQSFDAATGEWSALTNNVGIKVVGNGSGAQVAIATIEAAIDAGSALAVVEVGHVPGTAIVNFTDMDGISLDGTFHHGAFFPPDGEALKLTGLALELGFPGGLHRRIPPTQRV